MSDGKGKAAFTLVEMLVAMAVLVLLMGIIVQIVEMTGRSISSSSRHLDSLEQARMVFDRLQLDVSGRPRRADLPVLLSKAAGNDSLQFYSQVEGYGGSARNFTVVGYRIQQTNTARLYQMERGALGTAWTDTPPAFLPQASPAIPDADYDVLAGGVFRLEFCCLKTDGVLSTTAASDLGDVAAIIVALAVLDPDSRKLTTSSSQLEALAAALPDSAAGAVPLPAWQAALFQSPPSGIPTRVWQSIRIYQRAFYVR